MIDLSASYVGRPLYEKLAFACIWQRGGFYDYEIKNKLKKYKLYF